MGKANKLNIYYDSESDILSLWNGRPASEAADVAEHLVADFDDEGEVVGFTLEHAAEMLAPFLSTLRPTSEEEVTRVELALRTASDRLLEPSQIGE